MLEDDIQIDVRLPAQAGQPLPHVHRCAQGVGIHLGDPVQKAGVRSSTEWPGQDAVLA